MKKNITVTETIYDAGGKAVGCKGVLGGQEPQECDDCGLENNVEKMANGRNLCEDCQEAAMVFEQLVARIKATTILDHIAAGLLANDLQANFRIERNL
jgi:hypothetical protein